MAAIVRTITEPTDIYIVGTDYKELPQAFSLTDDYCGCTVTNGKQKVSLETDGYVFIWTLEEITKHQDAIWWECDSHLNDCCIVKNFVGDLEIQVVTREGEDILTDYDWKEYLMYQDSVQEYDGDVQDYLLVIPGEFEISDSMSVRQLYKSLGFDVSKADYDKSED